METNRGTKLNSKEITLLFEHNPYEINVYLPKKVSDKVILFPTFNYQGDKQYIDLIKGIVEKGYKVVTIKLLNFGDRVLFFNYYSTVFSNLLDDIIARKIINKEKIILFGYGVSANLVAYCHDKLSDNIVIDRLILISPVNKYKSEYRISKELGDFKLPTYIFYSEFDKVNDINSRYLLFESGRLNPHVHFSCYAATGYYLYYKPTVSMEMSKLYRNNNYDLCVGESKRNKNPFLPGEPELNTLFFKHLFNAFEGKDNPKRIALLTDVFPSHMSGMNLSMKLLKDELDKLGYETYIVGLWKKYDDFSLLPDGTYLPVIATDIKLVKGYNGLSLLKTFKHKENARMLAMFGFDYLHLHSEYSMSQTALELAKITGIKMPFTYHTLWKYYYTSKYGRLAPDMIYKNTKALCHNRVIRECPVVIVPSHKSQEIIRDEGNAKKIAIIPNAIDTTKYEFAKDDASKIRRLKNKYKLDDNKVIGYVGRVSTEKNLLETLNYMARIVKEIPNLTLMVVGTGDSEAALAKSIKKLHLQDHVISVDKVANEELKLYFSLFDVFASPSSFETQGLSYFEAAYNGVTVLTKKDKGIEGIFKDGENAYVYKDFYQWAEKMEKALFYNNKSIVDNAKSMMKKFNQDAWAKQILSIYLELNPTKKK